MVDVTTAGDSVKGPFLGYPAASAPVPAGWTAFDRCRGGAARSGTSRMATSTAGSNRTTRAGGRGPLPSTGTVGQDTPATTWALVSTRCGATTNPVPSCVMPQAGALPTMRTTLAASRRTAAVTSGPTGVILSLIHISEPTR